MENITIRKWGGGCSTNDHVIVGKEGGRAGGEGRKGDGEGCGQGEEKGGRGERWAWQTCLVLACGLSHGP